MEHNHVMGRDQLFYNVSWASFIPTEFVPILPIHLTSRLESEPIPQNHHQKKPLKILMFSQLQPQPHMASPNPNPKRCSSRLHVDLDPRGWRLWIQAGDSHLLGATVKAGKAQQAIEVG
jgi:hypothetical protein